MKRVFLTTTIALAALTAAQAQTGFIPASQSEFLITDMLNYSQSNYNFSTARSAAMGGAFTSLGADMASMSINPAGMGMYRSSEVGISPSTIFTKEKYSGVPFSENTNKSRFTIGNFGAVFNVYESSRSTLTSLSLGLSYNKIADYNHRGSVATNNNGFSIGDVFASQLTDRGISQKNIQSSADPFNNRNISPSFWGAILGYSRFFVDPVEPNNPLSNIYSVDPRISNDVRRRGDISHYATTISEGSTGEYNFSLGMNVQNKLYFGFSLTMADIYNNRSIAYEEGFYGNTNDANHIDYLIFDQWQRNTGTSTSAKIGVVYRPIDGLRLGVAFHTPAYTSLKREYGAGLFTQYLGADATNGYAETPTLEYNYKYTSAPKALVGISYTFGQLGILSLDYERVWYNGMRLKSGSTEVDNDYRQAIKREYKGANNLRAGLEVRLTPSVSLRGGYAHYGSMLKDNKAMFSSPVAYKTDIASAGVGFKIGRSTSLDFAYSYAMTSYTQYDLFIYQGQDLINSGDPIGLQRNLSNVIATLAFRF